MPNDVYYKTTASEITSIADAIRAKGGTSASLVYPSGFVSAISAIPTGGGGSELTDFIEINFGYSGSSTTYYNSYVTKIGRGKFAYQARLYSVEFPLCQQIYEYAFTNCSSLTYASFSLCSRVGDNAFYSCKSLSGLYMPSCSYIGSSAFYGNTALTEMSFSLVSYIGASAFYGAGLLNVSASLISVISTHAFAGMKSCLTANFISCKSLYSNGLWNCTKLQTVSFPSLESIGSAGFSSCHSLQYFDGPKVKYMYSDVFRLCSSLSYIKLSVFSGIIYSAAFSGCLNLLSLYLYGSSVVRLSNSNAFTSTPIAGFTTSTGGVLGSIYVPSSLLSAYQSSTNWTYFSSRFVGM